MVKKWIPLIIAIFLLEGCMGIGLYEDPKILDKGESRLGVGIPFAYIRSGFLILPIPEIYYRHGIGSNQDFLIQAPLLLLGSNGGIVALGGKYRFGLGKGILSLGLNSFISSENYFYLSSGGIYYRIQPRSLIGVQAMTGICNGCENSNVILRFYVGNRSRWKSNYYIYNSFQLIFYKSNVIGMLQTGIEIPLGKNR